MPLPIFDEITRKKLILVKQIYQNAFVQSQSHSSNVNKILSVIGFDFANETVLKTLVSYLDSTKTPQDSFQGLIQRADSLLSNHSLSQVPDKANIQYVHSIRNDAQHKAKYPNISDVNDCRTYSRDFLKKIVSNVWNIDFEKISLTDIIQNNKAKQFLIDAENAFDESRYNDTVMQASSGLTWAIEKVKDSIVGKLPSFTGGIVLLDNSGKPMSEHESQKALRTLEYMQETILYMTLGINFSEYMRYKALVGIVYFTESGSPKYVHFRNNFHSDEAEFILSFCMDTVVQIENRVEDLDKPFGLKK